jgi:hypothetical protein
MTPVWKETLLSGRCHDPKSGDAYTITDGQVKQALRNVNKMLNRSVPVPAVLEHVDLEAGDPDAWRAAYAKYCIGHIGAAKLSTADDVRSGVASRPGTLLLRHDVVDPDDVKILRRCKFVSPKIRPAGWMDSRGGTYHGATVTHSAITPSPVQYWQKQFQLSEDESLYFSCALENQGDEADPDDSDDPDSCPVYSDAFTEWLDALDLSATDEPDPEDDSREETEPMADEAEKPKGDDKPAEGGADADLKALIKALKARGMNIPDRVKDMAHLITAIEANGDGSEMPADEPPDDAPADDNGNPDDDSATVPAGGPPMVMSTLDKNPAKKKQALAWAKDERAELTARVNAALAGDGRTGRDPRTARQLLRQVGAVEMSFTDGAPSGKRWEKLVADVAAYETSNPTVRLKADGKPLDLSATQPVDRPKLGAGALKDPTGQLGADILGGKVSVADAAKK